VLTLLEIMSPHRGPLRIEWEGRAISQQRPNKQQRTRGCGQFGKATGCGGTFTPGTRVMWARGTRLTIRFDTEKKIPMIGRSSKTAAQNPKAEGKRTELG
jgi:hypothetical protein